ncbi:MAG: OmpW family outer membrane protein [Gammaproteobacteria bacterium]|nr:OmpW family outer membrane protein [Gammaproteobacteria bacterium]
MKLANRTVVSLAVAAAMLSASPAYAVEKGDWLVRFGPAAVIPNDDSGEVKPLAGTGVEVDEGTSLAFSLTYMLRDNVGIEVLGALPFEHDIKGDSGAIDGVEVATIEHLPPTVVIEYYFDPGSDIRTYIGGGVNYTTFMDESADSELEDIVGETDIELDDSVGLAIVGGIDIDINESWFFNASVWYIDIETTADLETAGAGDLEVDVDIDPWVVMVGVGTTF